MRAVVQRVSSASVRVEGETVGACGRGLLVLVGAGHEDRFPVAAGEVEQAAEQADAAQNFRAHGAPDQRLDAFDDFVARVDVDTGVAVGQWGGLRHKGLARWRERAGETRILT